MTDAPISPAPLTDADESIFGPRKVTQALLIVVLIASCMIFRFGARFAHWPGEPGFRGSLAQPPTSFVGFIAAIILLAVCAALGTLVLGRRWSMAGLLTATAGLAAWSVRGGMMTYVLFHADDTQAGAGIFWFMLGELIILFAVIATLWNVIWTRYELPRIASEKPEPGRSAFTALIAQAALMAIFMLILIVTPQKKQVLAGIFASGLFSTAIAEQFFADRTTGRWYWIGPLAVGVFGYIINSFSPAGMETGDLIGPFAPLSRALPLDYASLGCAGALLGYWWMTPEEETGEESEPQLDNRKTAEG